MCSHHRTEINAKGERICSTCGHVFAYATFDGWLVELAKVFVEKWDYTPENAKSHVLDQPEEWREFYADEHSPDDTAREDMRAGLE